MKRKNRNSLILVSLLFLFSIPFAFGELNLTACSDTDGDDPATSGYITWNATGSLADGKDIQAGGSTGDVCSEIHYVNVFLYAGEELNWGQLVLVENVCPSLGTESDEPGDIDWQTKKFYKCSCKNVEGSAFCIDTPQEVSRDAVRVMDEQWMESGKRELHPFLVKFLNFFGLWG
ncbi:MAG: hypothetical protein Q7K45_03770 [Nanoarchaeota archaeon]|nr:hypothetical protein [Nanoarchaeota archaeon]